MSIKETIVELEVCDGTCIDTGPENQCESCADLEMRIALGIIIDRMPTGF